MIKVKDVSMRFNLGIEKNFSIKLFFSYFSRHRLNATFLRCFSGVHFTAIYFTDRLINHFLH